MKDEGFIECGMCANLCYDDELNTRGLCHECQVDYDDAMADNHYERLRQDEIDDLLEANGGCIGCED